MDPPDAGLTSLDVEINNEAGKDIFGFDKCTLTFTPQNWNIPQYVTWALLPGIKRTSVQVCLINKKTCR